MKQLKIQDYIALGIYTAVYFLIMALVAISLSILLPGISFLFIPSVTALFSGIIYLLITKRIPRFGALTLLGCLVALFFLVSGYFALAFVPSILAGLLADIIQYRTRFSEKTRTNIGFTMFNFGLIGPVLPMWFMKDAYIDSLIAKGKDTTYIDRILSPISTASFFICVATIILCSLIGITLGRKLFNKHFSKNKNMETKQNVSDI